MAKKIKVVGKKDTRPSTKLKKLQQKNQKKK
jgi:hypothetical protein